MKNYEAEARELVKKKGLIAPKVVEKMTFEQLLKHMLMYVTTGELWSPEVKL